MEQSVSVVMALLMVVLAAAPVRGVNTFDTGAGTVYKLSVTQDVWLESGNRNYNNYEYIIVSKIPEYPNKRSLVQFEDLPSSCPSKNVTSAKMYLYYIYSHKPSFMSAKRVPFIPRYLQVHLVKKPWDESQATSTMRLRGIPWSSPWLALDGTDAEATPQQGTVTMFPYRPSGQFVEFDVTDAVTNWSSGVPNNGLVIRATNELVLGRSNRFASNGNSDTSKHAYVLVHCSDEVGPYTPSQQPYTTANSSDSDRNRSYTPPPQQTYTTANSSDSDGNRSYTPPPQQPYTTANSSELHLQFEFLVQKSRLFDFKICNSNFYRKNPSCVRFKICNSNFTRRNSSCVRFKIYNSNFYRKNPSCVYFKIATRILTAEIRVVCISKSATRILTAEIRVVCVSKFATRILTPEIRVVCISKFATRIFTAKIRVVCISKFATRIFTAKIRVVRISKFATRIFTAKIRVRSDFHCKGSRSKFKIRVVHFKIYNSDFFV